jgi:hypothetical protein
MGSMTSSSSEVGLKERLCFYVEVLELDEYYEKVLLTLTGDDSRLLLSATQGSTKDSAGAKRRRTKNRRCGFGDRIEVGCRLLQPCR